MNNSVTLIIWVVKFRLKEFWAVHYSHLNT